jgi:hypothetical protein
MVLERESMRARKAQSERAECISWLVYLPISVWYVVIGGAIVIAADKPLVSRSDRSDKLDPRF